MHIGPRAKLAANKPHPWGFFVFVLNVESAPSHRGLWQLLRMGLGPIFCLRRLCDRSSHRLLPIGLPIVSKQQQLQALVAPVVSALGFELWGLEDLAQGRQWTVGMFSDSVEGVRLDDWERARRHLRRGV